MWEFSHTHKHTVIEISTRSRNVAVSLFNLQYKKYGVIHTYKFLFGPILFLTAYAEGDISKQIPKTKLSGLDFTNSSLLQVYSCFLFPSTSFKQGFTQCIYSTRSIQAQSHPQDRKKTLYTKRSTIKT